MISARVLKRRGLRAYAVAALSICIALITVAFLSLAAYSARMEDGVELRRAEVASHYAAESGLVYAESKLVVGQDSPPAGEWLTGELPGGASTFSVEVLSEGHGPKSFVIRSTGQAVGEAEKMHSSELVVKLQRVAKLGWTVQWQSDQ